MNGYEWWKMSGMEGKRIVGLKRRKQNGELGFVLEALYMYSRKEEQKGRRKMDRMNENGGQ